MGNRSTPFASPTPACRRMLLFECRKWGVGNGESQQRITSTPATAFLGGNTKNYVLPALTALYSKLAATALPLL
ncbi:hypothetical protein XCR_0897 [Xanthomonas campestris pv. raphani 756C]|nr:hypothetical protein XCR_0897 [Xanthomonas campestris pv. raphani 756C]